MFATWMTLWIAWLAQGSPIGEITTWWAGRQKKKKEEAEERQRQAALRLRRLRQERLFRQQVKIAREVLPQIDPEAVQAIESEVPEADRDRVYVQVLGVKARLILGDPEGTEKEAQSGVQGVSDKRLGIQGPAGMARGDEGVQGLPPLPGAGGGEHPSP